MKTVEAAEILYAWEQGLNQPLLHKALILLTAACPEMNPESLAEMSIGQRDNRLLQLRERLFGQQLVNNAACPECGERIEWENNTTDYFIQADEYDGSVSEFDLDADDYSVNFRLPNSLDIAAVMSSKSAETAQHQLLSRCLLKVEHGGTQCEIDQLPDSILAKLNQQIEALDPQAEICINLSCPECSHRWNVLFDIASFLCTEINDWAERMLQTVHILAVGYGWSESEILHLSPLRRQLYLGMLGT